MIVLGHSLADRFVLNIIAFWLDDMLVGKTRKKSNSGVALRVLV